METRFTILLVEVGVAVAMQVVVLLAILVAVRKSTKRMETLADDLQRRALPLLDDVRGLVETSRPRVETIIANAAETSSTLRAQASKLDSTLTDVLERTRTQVGRANDIVARTLDRVETTTSVVEHTVATPVRTVAGVLQGLSAGLSVLLGRPRHGRNGDSPHGSSTRP